MIALLIRDLRLALRAGGGFGLGLAFFLILAPIFDWVSSLSALLLLSCFWFIALAGAYFILSILWVLKNQEMAVENEP